MVTQHPSHTKTLNALKRVEGQIRGIQRMVEEGRYCVDILTQLSAVASAVGRVQDGVLEKHLDCCVSKSFMGKSEKEKKIKIDEVIKLLKTFRKNAS